MRRPLLFLDVDGVLNPYGNLHDPGGLTPHNLFPGEDPVFVDRSHGALIARLIEVFDTVWATSWKDQANTLLAPLLGIPVLPVAQMPTSPFDPSEKISVIDGYAAGRAAAWIDDVHPQKAHDWARSRTAPTLLIAVDPGVGITKRIVDEALAWTNVLRQRERRCVT